MSGQNVEQWLKSRKYAMICRKELMPVEHPLAPKKPLSSQKGQATAYFFRDRSGNWWILKKFHQACPLDRSYLKSVSVLLPAHEGFICGTSRQILVSGDLIKSPGHYYTIPLNQWLDGTILMPQVRGQDWSNLADDLRDGKIQLDIGQRMILCYHLAFLISLLEDSQCAHRDLSCGNVFIDPATLQISLIDFDSFYHPSLVMPAATTCGTVGYTAPFVWHSGHLDPNWTWCRQADRFALALLVSEFLLVDSTSKATGEGGLFDQEELRQRRGSGLDIIYQRLLGPYSEALKLLKAAIHSPDCQHCPGPQDWLQLFARQKAASVTCPALDDVPALSADYLSAILAQTRPAAPLWTAPPLPPLTISLPSTPPVPNIIVAMPPDPWMKKP